MTIKLIRTEPIGKLQTSKGTLVLYPDLRPDDFFSLQEETPNIEKIDPKEYIQNLFQYLCHYEEYLPQDRSMPLKPSLSKDDIRYLTDNELNELASIYLKHRRHDKKEIKKDNESDIEYIHRLDIAQRKRLQEASDLAMAKYSGLFTISDAVAEQITDSLVASKALQESTSQMEEARKSAINHENLAVPIVPIPNTSEEIKRELQKLVKISSQAFNFTTESHETQLSISNATHNVIVSSGNEANKLTRKNIWLTIAVIIITVGVPIFTFFFIDPSNQKFIDKKTSLIVNKLDSINLNLNQTTNETKKLSSSLQKQNNRINELLKKNKTQEEIIKNLKYRLEEIEKKTK